MFWLLFPPSPFVFIKGTTQQNSCLKGPSHGKIVKENSSKAFLKSRFSFTKKADPCIMSLSTCVGPIFSTIECYYAIQNTCYIFHCLLILLLVVSGGKKRKSGHNSHKNEKDHLTKIDSPFFWFGGGLA